MSRLTESAIEDFAIKLFERLGYDYIHAPDIAPDGDRPERSRYDEVLLTGRLESALKRINPKLSPALLVAGEWLCTRNLTAPYIFCHKFETMRQPVMNI